MVDPSPDPHLKELSHLDGRITDLDSHLIVPPDILEEILGPLAQDDAMLAHIRKVFAAGVQSPPASYEQAWRTKGTAALDPSPAERVRLMNLMGIRRQLVLPNTDHRLLLENTPAAHEAVSRFNDYAIQWGIAAGSRCAVAVLLNMTDPQQALSEAKRVLKAGAGAVSIGSVDPPAGRSPASPVWDPLWGLLAEANAPAVLHFGISSTTGQGGVPDLRWGPPVPGPRLIGSTEQLITFVAATAPFGPQFFLNALIFGGVFERFPRLGFAVLEQTARWVGPWCDYLDWIAGHFSDTTRVKLSLKPSEYVRRQVRVTPLWLEPVRGFIEQYGLEEVYAFGSDFPHPEGGTEPVKHLMSELAPLGESCLDGFFVKNGQAILPGLTGLS